MDSPVPSRPQSPASRRPSALLAGVAIVVLCGAAAAVFGLEACAEPTPSQAQPPATNPSAATSGSAKPIATPPAPSPTPPLPPPPT